MTSKEVLPNVSDGYQSLRYIQDQALRGHFKGHPVAHHVMMYLIMNMWTKVPNKEEAGIGMVMAGRTGLDNIAAHTALSKSSVQRALRWLEDEGWIETERSYAPTGREDRRYILVLLDSRSHTERQRRYDVEVAIGKIMEEGSQSDHQGGSQSDHPRGSQSDHP